MSHRRERKNAKKEKNKDKPFFIVSNACTFYHVDKSVNIND